MTGIKRFGDPARFAIDIGFSPDPHEGLGALPVHAASWGTLRLWVGGRNLCEYRAEGVLHDAIDWYLFPLFTWLVENWDPLFHEQRFPEAVQPRIATTRFSMVGPRFRRQRSLPPRNGCTVPEST